jgi:hypothetical protein
MLMHRRDAVRWVAAPFAMAAWMAMVAAGFRALEAYEGTPGATGRAPPDWPEGSALGFVPRLPNVVMAVHPRCPCSRASLDLLAEIAQSAPSTSSIRLLIFRPEGTGLGWAGETCPPMLEPMWGAIRVDDPGGREAARFGLATSGAVAAFDAAGRLRFLGGLNARRGRVVPSGGAEDVASVLAGREPIRRAAAVFGCAMAGATRRPDSRRAEP